MDLHSLSRSTKLDQAVLGLIAQSRSQETKLFSSLRDLCEARWNAKQSGKPHELVVPSCEGGHHEGKEPRLVGVHVWGVYVA